MEAGIDEAGRGPVLGPLVVGLVAAPDASSLAALRVRDSKLVPPRERDALSRGIRAVAERVETIRLDAAELDRRMARQSLNQVEVELFAELARRVEAATYFLDACDTDAGRFGRAFLAALGPRPHAPRAVSEHHADARYPLVAAASIIAKVERDRAVAEIARRLEPQLGRPLGSGYASDPTTIAFLREYLARFEELPPDARATWATSRELRAARWQRALSEY